MHNEEDDMEIIKLRQQALKTLIESKKSQQNEQMSHHANFAMHDQRPHHHLPQQQPMIPQVRYPLARPEIFHPHFNSYPAQRQQFLSIRPPVHIQPHVNPHYQPNNFNPAPPDALMMNSIDVPKYEPTPPSRLSPRSASFVAANEEALRKSSQRSKNRSRSRSPRFGKKRSRSPNINHIARKRSRSKSPGFNSKKMQPRRRSPYRKNGHQRNFGNFRDRTNGDRPKSFERNNKNLMENDNKSPKIDQVNETPSNEVTKDVEKVDEKKETAKKREKTAEELLEDELLASTDDELTVTLDEDELDFLDDDDEESENEGRFKSKPASEKQQKPTVKPNFQKNNFSTNRYDKRNARNHDYNRNSRKSRTPPSYSKKQSNSFESTTKPNTSNLAPSTSSDKSREPISISKNDEKPTKIVIQSSVTKHVDNGVSEKPKGNDNRIRLVRTKVTSKVEVATSSTSFKKVDEKFEKSSSGKSEKAIMKRLGGYIGESKATSWAKDQAT